jgi:hypothetical protein
MGQTRVVPTATEFEQLLRGAALRVTRPRLAVLAAVYEHPHADTDSIVGVVRSQLGAVSTQAVYDVLRASPTITTTSSAARAAPSRTSTVPSVPRRASPLPMTTAT